MRINPTETCAFTHDHLRETLAFAIDAGYRFISFTDTASRPPSPSILLRHDIDHLPRAARELAEIEAALGVRATFFILLSSEYNALGPALADLQQIVGLGHWIGVHYDPVFYQQRALPFPESVHRDAQLLSERLGVEVSAAARHNPVVADSPAVSLLPLIDTYDEGIRTAFEYKSDSCQFWRDGCFCNAVTRPDRPSLQVLIHGEWWTPTGARADVILERIRDERIASAAAVHAETRRLFAGLEHLPTRELFRADSPD